MADQQEERIPLTKEQIAKRRLDLVEFYKEQIKFLTHQRNYEALITELEELNMRRIMAQMRVAQMTAPPPPDKDLDKQEDLDPNEGKMPEVPTNTLQTTEQPNEPIPTLQPRKLKTT